jgi:hypothetical protein
MLKRRQLPFFGSKDLVGELNAFQKYARYK